MVDKKSASIQLSLDGLASPRSVLVTIPPELVVKILSGEKQVEFRKAWPKAPIDRVWFCERGSGGRVVARANVVETLITDSDDAWRRYGALSGVAANKFFAYAKVHSEIHCVVLTDVEPVRDTFIRHFEIRRPPQNYVYIDR